MTVTLTAGIGFADASISLSGALPDGTSRVQVGSEQMDIAGAGLVSLVVRGVNGTLRTSHLSGAAVSPVYAQTSVGAPGVAGATGSATSPVALPAAGNLEALYGSAQAAGDHRDIYARLYFAADGASGEAVRGYGLVDAAAAGTVNGAHLSLKVETGGSVTGAAHAIRGTFESDASVNVGGTSSVLHLDTSFGSSATPSSGMAFISLDNLGTPKPNYMLSVTNPGTTMFATAGTGANSAAVSTGGVAAKVLKVSVSGVDYWLPLYSSNS